MYLLRVYSDVGRRGIAQRICGSGSDYVGIFRERELRISYIYILTFWKRGGKPK